jgi:hypothetical protein
MKSIYRATYIVGGEQKGREGLLAGVYEARNSEQDISN